MLFSNDPALGFIPYIRPNGVRGYSFATLLGRMLELAEETYGRRDLNWTPIGIEFSKDGPNTWFPGDNQNVAINLSLLSAQNEVCAIFELGHEIIHVLAPRKRETALNIEEGLATFNSYAMCAAFDVEGKHRDSIKISYKNALIDFEEFNLLAPNGIKVLRKRQMSLFDWTPGFITEFFPNISKELAQRLCTPFIKE